MSDQRFNTGNPIGSDSPLDRSDNTRNLDVAVNTEQDTFQDRLGKSRLTWTGIQAAGTGDTSVAVDAAARAVDAAGRAENAEAIVDAANIKAEVDRAETAAEVAMASGWIYPSVAVGYAAREVGDYFWTVSASDTQTLRLWRAGATEAIDTGKSTASSSALYSAAESVGVIAPYYGAYPVNLDVRNGLLKVFGAVRCYFGNKAVAVSQGEYPLPATNSLILVDKTTGELSFHAIVANSTIPTNACTVGSYLYLAAPEELGGFPSGYQVNGRVPKFGVFGVTTHVTGDLIEITTSTAEMVVPERDYRLVAGSFSTLIPAASLTVPIGGSLLAYQRSTAETVLLSSHLPISTDHVVFGRVINSGSNILLYGVDKFSIDGKRYNGNYTSNSSDPVESVEWFGELVAGDPSEINFSYERQQVEITSSVRLVYGGVTRLVPAQIIPSALQGSLPARILVNTDDLTVRLDVRVSQPIPESHVQVGTLVARYRNIHGIASYSIDGVPGSGLRLRRLRHPYIAGQFQPPILRSIVVNGTTDPGFTLPNPLPEQATFLSTATHLDVYAKYDALQAAHPDYITRTLIGQDESGANVYQYDFKQTDTDAAGADPTTGLAKVIAVSGVHGNEKAGVMNLYETLREICENWGDDERLETLRWNVHFIVVPVVVPWGFDNSRRQNMNGVDVNRNFSAGWVANGSPWDTDYPGTEPLSEVEARNIDAVLDEHSDAVLFTSFHNISASSSNFIWASCGSVESVQLARAIISRQARIWRKRYSWFPDGYFGYANVSAPQGSENMQGTLKYGILSCVFEVSQGVPMADAPENAIYSSTSTTMGVETYVNWLLLGLDYGARLKNTADFFYTV